MAYLISPPRTFRPPSPKFTERGAGKRPRVALPSLCCTLALLGACELEAMDDSDEDIEMIETEDGGLEGSLVHRGALIHFSSRVEEVPLETFGEDAFIREGRPLLDDGDQPVADPDGDNLDRARVVRIEAEDGRVLAEWVQHMTTQVAVGHFGDRAFGLDDSAIHDWRAVRDSEIGEIAIRIGRYAIQRALNGEYAERDDALWALELTALELDDLVEADYQQPLVAAAGPVVLNRYPGQNTYEYLYGCNLRSHSPHISSQHWRRWRRLRVKAVSQHRCPSDLNYRLHRSQNYLERVNSLGQWIRARQTTKECYNCASLRDHQTIKWCRRGTRFTWRLATAHWIKKRGQAVPRIKWTKAVRRFTCKPPS